MVMFVGETAPYRAANGHMMAAPLVVSDHAAPGTPGRPVSSWARCVPACSACSAGDDPAWYAGEEW
jgi:hypothetical protein